METKIIDALTAAILEVLTEIGFKDLSISEGNFKNMDAEIVANIGITGDMQGFLILSAKLGNAIEFVKLMLSYMEMENEEEDFGPFHREAFGEILNQISGRCTIKLSEKGIDSDISPPTIITGKEIHMDLQSVLTSFDKTVNGDFGEIGFLLGIKKIEDG